MPAILEMPEVRARVARLSIKNYEELVEQGHLARNVELIRGVLIEKMSKSPLHIYLTEWLRDHLQKQVPPGWLVREEKPLRLVDDSEPEPDVAIVRGERRDYREEHPTLAALVVEVALSSAALDRENASLYAEAGVPEYWIVLGRERRVEVYRQPEAGVYQQKRLYALGEILVCESVPELQVPLSEWFA